MQYNIKEMEKAYICTNINFGLKFVWRQQETLTLNCGDRDSYGDDTMMWPGVVTNNLGPGTTSQLRPAETRIPESPGHQTADSQVLRHSGHLNWNYFNNHRNKMATESRGKS